MRTLRFILLKCGYHSVLVTILLSWGCCATPAQEKKTDKSEPTASETEKQTDESKSILPHSQTSRFWVSGQVNVILQWHPSFKAKYSGENSLKSHGENATSRVLSLYTGAQLSKTTEVFAHFESAGGKGISDALGAAGFTNLDVVRNPTLGSKPYLARLMVRQIIPLSTKTIEAERNQFALATKLPLRRLEIRAGKFSTADFFDVNSSASDSHLQFMNWTVDNNGAYDYAADTRGYTYGMIIEYQDRDWGVRFGEMLIPKVANGIKLDWNLHRARGENLEFELRHNFLPQRKGIVRLLAYANHANMGSYREAIESFLSGNDPVPDIEAHRRQGRVKYGFGSNFEQEIGDHINLFGRLGWNEGRKESFAYTEVDNTTEIGIDFGGKLWHRRNDKTGAAFVSNGISRNHRKYLELGGRGFLLGDGALTYGRETIFETYYTTHLWGGVFASLDFQYLNHPGYNRDRGPVLVPAIRLHFDL